MTNPDPSFAKKALEKITSRLEGPEREILTAMLAGLSVSDIAKRLGTSQHHVRFRHHRLLRKIRPWLEAEMTVAGERVSPTTLPVYVDPGSAPVELVTELFVALACVYRSLGGSGLIVTRDEQRSVVGEAQQ